MKEFLVFIDESGTKEIEDNTQNIFCICGVVIENVHLDKVRSDFKDLLNQFFNRKW